VTQFDIVQGAKGILRILSRSKLAGTRQVALGDRFNNDGLSVV
jgi:hypothetical protein